MVATLAVALAITLAGPGVGGAALAPSTTGLPRGQLAALLLTTSQMPVGWTVHSTAQGSGTASSCLARFEAEKAHATSVYISFSGPGGLSEFEEVLHSPGRSQALPLYRSARTGLDSCADVTLSSQGQTVSGTIAPLALPPVGQRSAGYVLSFRDQGVPLRLDVDLFLQGSVVGVTSLGSLQPDPATMVRLTQRAVAKVARSSGSTSRRS